MASSITAPIPINIASGIAILCSQAIFFFFSICINSSIDSIDTAKAVMLMIPAPSPSTALSPWPTMARPTKALIRPINAAALITSAQAVFLLTALPILF